MVLICRTNFTTDRLTDIYKAIYGPYSADLSKIRPRDFSRVRTATLCRSVELIWANLKPRVLSRWSAGEHTADCRSFRWQDISYSSSGLATKSLIENKMQNSDKSIQCKFDWHSVDMYVNNLTGPWFSIYNVPKCDMERKTCNPVYWVTCGPSL